MRRYGQKVSSRQWREIRLLHALLQDWGAKLYTMNARCVVRRIEAGFAGRR